MRKLRELEDVLIRAESALAVVLVLVMLALAGYNVVYRNVLVPLQQHWAHSGPPRSAVAAEVAPGEAARAIEPERTAEPQPSSAGGADDFGGFGGGLGEGDGGAKAEPASDDFGGFGGGLNDEAEAQPAKAEPASDDFGGFGGGLNDEAAAEPADPPKVAAAEPAGAEPASDDFGGFGGGLNDEPEPADPPKVAAAEPTSDDFGGFGGGLNDGGDEPKTGEGDGADGFGGFGGGLGEGGGEAAAGDEPDAVGEDDLGDDELGEDDLGDDDQFANLPDIDAAAKTSVDDLPDGGPPPEGSFEAKAVAFIDAIKLDWIDIFLRQLVIIVSFFGAMLATQRGKHINIDALSKVLPPKARRVVAVVIPLAAVSVCLVLASAGYDLVQIGREYPKELLPWAEEWTLQLMFPVGFGLLAFHFGIRVIEAILTPPDAAPPPPTPGPAPLPTDARGDAGASAEHEGDEDDDAHAEASSEHDADAPSDEDEDEDEDEDDAARPQGGQS